VNFRQPSVIGMLRVESCPGFDLAGNSATAETLPDSLNCLTCPPALAQPAGRIGSRIRFQSAIPEVPSENAFHR